ELLYSPPNQIELTPLLAMLKATYNVPVYVDNNANMAVLAEKAFTDYQSNLFSVTLQSGIGLGILLNDEVFRGFTGYAGEVGHMIIRKNGVECRCGNKGCFEQYASDEVLKQALADHNISLHDHPTYASLMADQKTKAVIKDYISDLAVGLNNIINIFNPRKLVINSRIFTQY